MVQGTYRHSYNKPMKDATFGANQINVLPELRYYFGSRHHNLPNPVCLYTK